MNNGDYIPLDKAVIEENVKGFEDSRKVVLSKIRFDKGFEDSVVALDFLNELMKEFEREIQEARETGKSDFDYVFWDYCTEDASEEVLALCEAARKAHKAALLEWERKHPAEHEAEVARAQAEYDAWEAAEIDRAD